MSAPESTSSKGRPSLLSKTAPGAADSSSRILASLEGRAVAQPIQRRRSKKPLMVAALAVIGFGAFGAWQWQRVQQGEPTVVAGAPAAQAGASVGKAQPATPASVSAAALVAAASGAAAASTPQAAVIVADDPVQADRAASSSPVAGNDPLSRALASGAAPADKGASGTNAAVVKRAPAAVASRTEREAETSRHGKKEKKGAAERAGKHAKTRSRSAKEDPDADLLAALVARTKPYEPNAAGAHAPKGASAGAASAKAAQPSAGAHHASLNARLKACDKGNFFEAQACRWRVCSDHWGKDPACPSTASAAQTH